MNTATNQKEAPKKPPVKVTPKKVTRIPAKPMKPVAPKKRGGGGLRHFNDILKGM